MRKLFLALGVSASAFSACAVQDVTVTDLSVTPQAVTISYTLASTGDAIVTFDILTNGVSIGAANLTGGDVGQKPGISGDANRRVTGPYNGTIVWRPCYTWRDASVGRLHNVTAVVKAWSPFAPPDYMVVDLTKSGAESTRFYESEAALPGGGVKALDDYRTTKLVMRRIHAPACGTFMMFSKLRIAVDTQNRSPAENDAARLLGRSVTDRHVAELADDYWMGVFELTQKQYETVMGEWPKSFFTNEAYRAMRPVEGLYPNEFRGQGWPEAPMPDRFVGRLRALTQMDFDQPTEAQWEYAACAGENPGHYPDGSRHEGDLGEIYPGCGAWKLNTHVMKFARMLGTTRHGREQVAWAGTAKPDVENIRDEIADGMWDAEDGTAVVGSYAPNNWGLYDVLGNVAEVCLDWVDFRYADSARRGLGVPAIRGAVNVDPDNWRRSLTQKREVEDVMTDEPYRVTRGGAWFQVAEDCHPANRANWIYDARWMAGEAYRRSVLGIGYRLCCPVK